MTYLLLFSRRQILIEFKGGCGFIYPIRQQL